MTCFQETTVLRPSMFLSVRAQHGTGVSVGSNALGLMYAALDVADHIRWVDPGDDPLEHVRNVPYMLSIRKDAV